jgi:hypothetical protein
MATVGTTMIHTITESIKKQRMVWSWGLIIALFLVVVGHAPVLPVIAGCALAIAFSTWRSGSSGKLKPSPIRGGR